MKITKRQLRRIIKEAAGSDDYHLQALESVFEQLRQLADGPPPEEYPGEWQETVANIRDHLGEVLGKW